MTWRAGNRSLLVSVWFFLTWASVSFAIEFYLDGQDWTFYNQNRSIVGKAKVPGGIYSDLRRNGISEQDPLYDDNDVKFRWVGNENWTYFKEFSVSPSMQLSKGIFLVCHGLDTIAAIYVNGILVGESNNSFVRYKFDVKPLLKTGRNNIRVAFQSPIAYAKKMHEEQSRKSYVIPPTCPPEIQNGECHINYMRKMQSSFSWDWGPAFPSVGIWKSIGLEVYDYAMIRDIMVDTVRLENGYWAINTSLIVETATNETFPATIQIYLGSRLLVEKRMDITLCPLATQSINFFLPLNYTKIELWWPNQAGKLTEKGFEPFPRTLYKLKAIIKHSYKRQTSHIKVVKVGFRTIELVQDRHSIALSFYFRVNGHPIFMKGSNLIPTHILPERASESDKAFLLRSAAAANMNMLRIWGGGIYESDEFYDLADELGILIWQDFMFAVALYPANCDFLASVKIEVHQQLARLQRHPSIAIWAGNNENELAIASSWWPEVTFNPESLSDDYRKLYIDEIRSIVLAKQFSIIYASSSPSNGLETEKEQWIAKNPNSNLYGDVHHYDYNSDAWDWKVYPRCKFVSEYGFQSFPSLTSLSNAIPPSELDFPPTPAMRKRQHHASGDQQMEQSVETHLLEPFHSSPVLKNLEPIERLRRAIYLTQLDQAMSIRTETEFYRRNRKVEPSGYGMTMGALYWQLNDVWQAPTWSSIDFNGEWKVLHYFALNMFEPILISPYIDNNEKVIMSLINDALNPIDLRVRILMYKWDRFDPVAVRIQNAYCDMNTVCSIFTYELETLLQQAHCESRAECVIFIEYENMEGTFAGSNFLLLSYPKTIQGLKPSGLRVVKIEPPSVMDDGYHYEISIEAKSPSLFVWLNFALGSDLEGVFSENGFFLFNPTKKLFLISPQNYTTNYLMQQIQIMSFNDFKAAI